MKQFLIACMLLFTAVAYAQISSGGGGGGGGGAVSSNIEVTNVTANTANIDWNGPKSFRYAPSGPFVLSFVNTPPDSSPERNLDVTILNQNTGTFPVTVDWGADVSPIFVTGITNRFRLKWTSSNVVGFSYQSSGRVSKSVTPSAGAITLVAELDEPVVWVDAGSANLTLTAIMGFSSTRTRAYRGTLILTNRTGTPRTFTLSAVTNNFINLQLYDGVTAPYTITNSVAARFNWESIGTNVQHSLKYLPLPADL